MSDIIPRKKAIPVQARRADAAAETIQVPGAPPISVPPVGPGVTQNIIYVNIPAGQAPPPPQPSGPSEVHFHTTNVYQSPKRRRQIGTSTFGLFGLVIGVIAGLATYLPQTISFSGHIAMAGATCAGLGLLGAVLLGRVGKGVPLLALLVCGASYCLMLKSTGQLPASIALPKFDLDSSPASPAPAGSSAAPSVKPPVNQLPQDRTRLHDNSIFGDGQGAWVRPGAPAGAASSVPSTPATPTPIVPAPSAVPAIDLATATANLEKARTAAAQRMNVDYAGAKSVAADAQTEYQDAKIANAPGSPELIDASRKHLQADSQLNQVESQLRADPAVAAAEAVVKTAKSSGR